MSPDPLPAAQDDTFSYDSLPFTNYLEEEVFGVDQNVGIEVLLTATEAETNAEFSFRVETLKLIIRQYERQHNGVEVRFGKRLANEYEKTYSIWLIVHWPPRALMRKPANALARKQPRGSEHRSKKQRDLQPA